MSETTNDKSATLSDRVRSLRLTESNEPTSRGSGWAWIPWTLCAVLLCSTSLLALEAFSPIDDDLVKKLAQERGLDLAKGQANQAATSLSKLGVQPKGDGVVLEIALESKGNIVPISLIQVSPKVGGTVTKLKFKEGDEVKTGDTLAEIEDIEFRSERDRALATMQVKQSLVHELEKYIHEEIDQAHSDWRDTNAQRDQAFAKYQRYVLLKQRGSVTPEDFDLVRSTYESLDFRAHRLEVSYKLMKEEGKGPRYEKIAAAKAEVRQAAADLVKFEWRFENTKVKAPAPGIILSKKTEEGNIVNPSAFSNGLSASLCEMADLLKMEVDLSIAERDIAKLFKDQECRIRPEAFPGRIYKGYVSRIMPMADRSKSSVPVRVKIEFPGIDAKGEPLPMDKQGEYLRPEMGAIVTFLNRKVQ